MSVGEVRRTVQTTTVQVVYRHICSDAIRAASMRDWLEHRRLLEMARQLEQAYPAATFRARFAQEVDYA